MPFSGALQVHRRQLSETSVNFERKATSSSPLLLPRRLGGLCSRMVLPLVAVGLFILELNPLRGWTRGSLTMSKVSEEISKEKTMKYFKGAGGLDMTDLLVACFPDLNPLYFFFSDDLKSLVATVRNLKAWIVVASADIASTLDSFERVRQSFARLCRLCGSFSSTRLELMTRPPPGYESVTLTTRLLQPPVTYQGSS
ncbi:hypothetical protein TNCV_4150811 [Trichonephila clavipes]|nr:hypothetical protein TNCV_4150811 [Trichonephila clavipes]